MATEQLFTVAGVVTVNGDTKARFANDLVSRIKIFKDAARVNLIELPQALTKLQALEYLAAHADFQDADASFAIQSKLTEKRRVAKKGEVKFAASGVKTLVKDTVVA